MEPLYTLPKPPSPIFNILLKFLVASLSSERVKTLKFCSLSLYISGMLRADDTEPVDLVTLSPSGLPLLLLSLLNSGADSPLRDLDLSLNM